MLHTHPFTELFYVTKGKGQYRIEHTYYTVEAGDLFLLKPSIAHAEISLAANPMEYVVVGFSGTNPIPELITANKFRVIHFDSSSNQVQIYLSMMLQEVTKRRHRYRQNVSLAVFIHTADYKHCHTYNSAVHTNFFVQCVHPQNGITALGKRAAAESVYLFVQPLCHLADLAAGQAFNSQAPGQLFHLTSGYALHKCLLHHLDQCRFTAFALRNKERDVAAMPHLRHHEIHGAHPGIQSARSVATAISTTAFGALAFLRPQLLAYLGFHELAAQPFQHTQHGVRLRHALQ